MEVSTVFNSMWLKCRLYRESWLKKKKRLEKQMETKLYRPMLVMRFKLYPIANGAPLKNFKQRSDVIKFTFYVSIILG